MPQRYVHIYVPCCTVHGNQVIQPSWVSINRRIYAENVVSTHNKVLFIHNEELCHLLETGFSRRYLIK